MIIIRIMGGLGNQLQQYALYQKFILLGKDAYLDTTWFDAANQDEMAAPRKLELELFEGASFNRATKEQVREVLGSASPDTGMVEKIAGKLARKLHVVKETYFVESQMFHPEIFDMENVYLQGYWAAEKYYADILPALRDKLAFSHISDENRIMAAQIEQAACMDEHTCSVHIRRGDYLDPDNKAIFGGIATEEYYDSAFEYVRKRFPNTVFYIFSDDQEYVRERYGNDEKCRFVDINHFDNSRYDIYLMSKCISHICANSTFSFWGARLDEKSGIKIRPTIHKNSQIFNYDEMSDLWKGWTFIDPTGDVRDN